MKKLLLFLLLIPSTVFAMPGPKQWQAVWNANPEGDIAGYYLYYRADSESFDNARRIDTGNVTSYPLNDNVPANSYIALTAYDTAGNESMDFGSELFFDKDVSAPSSVTGFGIAEVSP